MANFKVGDKARLTGPCGVPDHDRWMGSEVTIVGALDCYPMHPGCYQIDGPMCAATPGIKWFCGPRFLAPLTPPGFIAFMDKVLKSIDEEVAA